MVTFLKLKLKMSFLRKDFIFKRFHINKCVFISPPPLKLFVNLVILVHSFGWYHKYYYDEIISHNFFFPWPFLAIYFYSDVNGCKLGKYKRCSSDTKQVFASILWYLHLGCRSLKYQERTRLRSIEESSGRMVAVGCISSLLRLMTDKAFRLLLFNE